ncbi:MAG: hypothetical protein AUK44_09685 [Porphyromonadaceae bacterium CG2_30_38_12]|nr:MAG: hypothetical protein AUK44_09685 [Porphyromonadaceae bacterium CG2_30_38_12]
MCALVYLSVLTNVFSQVEITKWEFEGGTPSPAVGSGTLTNLGGISNIFSTGIAPNTVSAEGTTGTTRGTFGYNTSNYPSASNGAKTAGVQFSVSTIDYKDIQIAADIRHSNTSANKVVLQYTTNGTDWIDATTYGTPAGGDNWYLRTYDFRLITSVNNNANFAVRYVTDFDGATYLAAKSTSNYATTGTIRFDNVVLKGVANTAALTTPKSNTWFVSNSTLTLSELPTSTIEVYTLTGSKAAAYKPAKIIDLNLFKGIYILKIDGKPAKITIR